jgi:hypothetical protein
MAVASGLYGLTLEEMMIDTLAESIEAEDHYAGLVTDTHTPDFTLHDFVADITNEITGGNYARDTITATEVTLAAGTLTFDHIDTLYDNGGGNDVTITNAEAQFMGLNVGTDATDHLMYMLDFTAPASCTASTFTTQIHANGVFTLDYTP